MPTGGRPGLSQTLTYGLEIHLVGITGHVERPVEVAVTPHHALRHAGGAARVHHHDVIGTAAPRRPIRAGGAAAHDRLVPLGPIRARTAAVVDPQPPAHRGDALAHRRDGAGKHAVEDDRHGVGVVPEVRQLVGSVPVVRVHRCEASLVRRVGDLQVFRAVVQVLRHPVARPAPPSTSDCASRAARSRSSAQVVRRSPWTSASWVGRVSATTSHTSAYCQPPPTSSWLLITPPCRLGRPLFGARSWDSARGACCPGRVRHWHSGVSTSLGAGRSAARRIRDETFDRSRRVVGAVATEMTHLHHERNTAEGDAMDATAMVLAAPRSLGAEPCRCPRSADDDALLRVEACGLCGTDHEQYSGQLHPGHPFIPGHETVGVIEQIGPVSRRGAGASRRANGWRSRCSGPAGSATPAGPAPTVAASATGWPPCTASCPSTPTLACGAATPLTSTWRRTRWCCRCPRASTRWWPRCSTRWAPASDGGPRCRAPGPATRWPSSAAGCGVCRRRWRPRKPAPTS